MALPLPPWFGPRTVLEEVEQLVLNDNANAAQGWTWQQIRDSLMQTHQQNQQGLPQGFNAALRGTLSRLRERGHLMTGAGGPQRYTLSNTPPYFPPWFGPGAVLQAVGNDAGGLTWAQIRDSLLRTHQPQHPQPPPDFDRLLRAMLSVLRQRGHLRVIGHNQRYTRQQAPAPAEPNPILIPDYLWCYYLGYKLGANDGLDDGVELGQVMAEAMADDSDSDEEMDEDA